MEIDRSGKWQGEPLPEDCTLVHLQWLDACGNWIPDGPMPAYDRENATRMVADAVGEGPLRFEKYRLIPARGSRYNKEKMMAKKAKKATAKKPVASVNEKLVKVAGFRGDSLAARMYTLMADGKPRSVAEIHKVLNDTTLGNVGNGLLYALRKRGYETGEFNIVNENHLLRLEVGSGKAAGKAAKEPKAAHAKTVPVKAAKGKKPVKAAGKAVKATPKKDSKKKAAAEEIESSAGVSIDD